MEYIVKTDEKFPEGTVRIVPMDTLPSGYNRQVHHVVTFDFSGCTIEEVMAHAIDALKVKIANPIRKNPHLYPEGALNIPVGRVGNGRGRHSSHAGITREMLRNELMRMQEAGEELDEPTA